jgi:HK97 family phage portal protein
MRRPAFLRTRALPSGGPLEAEIAAALAARVRTYDPRTLPVVVGIRSLVADTSAMLPLVALRGVERIDPQPAVLRRPDPNEPYRVSIEKIVNSLTASGNAFVRRWQVGSDGWPIAVKVLDPARIVVQLDTWQETIVGYTYNQRPLRTSQVLHIPLISDPGPLGQSPLDLIGTVIDDLATAYEWAAGYWRDGGTPPYALTHPQKLDDDQATSMVERWLVARRTRRPALLSGGMGLTTFTQPSAAEALLIEGLNYLDAAIARALNVPPSIVNVVSQQALTYSTTIDEMRRWLTLNLYPTYLDRLEAAFTDLLPRGQAAVFDTSNLLRTDWSTRVTTAAAAVAAGLASVDEMRVSQLGLPAMSSGPVLEPVAPNVEGV